MTKKDIIDFLEPFDDETGVVVRGAKMGGPVTYQLEYLPFTDERPALVAICLKGVGFVDTSVGA